MEEKETEKVEETTEVKEEVVEETKVVEEEPKVEEPKEEVKEVKETDKPNKKKKVARILLLILSVVLIGLGGYLIYNSLNLDNSDDVENNKKDDNNKEENKEDEEENKPEGYNGKKECIEKIYGDNGELKCVKYVYCKTDNCEKITYETELGKMGLQNDFDNKYLFKEDNKVVIYDTSDGQNKIVYEKNGAIDAGVIILYDDNNEENIYLVFQNSAKKLSIYDYKNKKDITGYDYDYVGVTTKDYMILDIVAGPILGLKNRNALLVGNNNKYGIIDIKTGKVLLDIKYDSIVGYYDAKEYYTVKLGDKIQLLKFDYDKNEFVDYDMESVIPGYSTNGSIYNNVTIVTTKDNKNYFVNLDNKKYAEIILDSDLELGMYWGWDNTVIAQYEHTSYDEGVEERFKNYIYNIKTNTITIEDNMHHADIAKPILYLYPTEPTKVTVDFEYNHLLTTTYPKFVGKWEVFAQPNGDLYDKDGKYYYGLYWEESMLKECDFSEGFYVEKDDAIEFLEEKLTTIGLNARERNEFIMYWLPILEKNGKNLVYFELTEERENNNKININPRPDSLLRIVIHVKKVDKKVNIKEEKLTSFERKGFTAVEWGGHNYK